MKAIFYVYIYLDSEGVPFYIGKGKGQRFEVYNHIQKSSPNQRLKNKIRKVGVDNVQVKFLHRDVSEEIALYLEEYYIAGYGRRDKGLGPLCNASRGGEGESGRVLSESHKHKIARSMKGNQNGLGHVPSESTRQKIGSANRIIRTGRTVSESTKRKMSKTMRGRKHTEESKRKMSIARKGYIPTKETLEKLSKALRVDRRGTKG